ncbi:amino acid ABC transporter permease [Amphritea sp. 2_MG-2023]|uniref:amino acid ABC transporter permease n=1 Tax=Amphritea TaxID=515417 RepID=UPI001C07DD4B|nr:MULTISPECIES: amino acid ABC transporter permease [Amphritea]MBU2965810.1 amino acid ABC transporter permease [Amphritea atlantica]MDO6417366.1 amino acid ABC transporter permease [Amphritea sp. 2_MG-2023]
MISDFLTIWGQLPDIWNGFLNTLILVIIAATISLLMGILLTPMLMSSRPGIARIVELFCDAMRCVPFLLFVYLIYFALPTMGIRLSNWTSGVLALVLYNSAYMALLLRGAWQDLPADTIESGKAFGFQGFSLMRRIIMPPVIMRAIPSLGNQLIQIVKDSAFLSIIAVTELTSVMNSIQSTYFIPFAAFLTAVLLYWLLCLCIEIIASILTRYSEERRT